MTPEQKPFSRRQLLRGAGAGGLAAALVPVLRQSEAPLGRLATFGSAPAAGTEGTPEQVHLTWGEDPTSSGTPNPNYSQFEQFTVVRPRSDKGRGRRP